MKDIFKNIIIKKQEDEKRIFDISQIISPSFIPVRKAVLEHKYTHYNLGGGRGSTKSSYVSCQIIELMKLNRNCHALVLRKVANTLRDSVYAQYCWAVSQLGLDDEIICKVSPMEIIFKKTGQKILFRGADDKAKLKSIKVSDGYIGFIHVEEKDQFSGRSELRNIYQSVMRGGSKFWVFETYNPPVSVSNWANVDSLENRLDRLNHKSTYLDVPKEWIGEQFITEAQILRKTNERAYRHEYLGEPTGTGGNVFENVVVRKIPDNEVKEFDRIYNGLDFGWYPDPLAFIQCYFNSAQRKLYIFYEYVVNKKSNAEAWNDIKANAGDELITADSAEPKSIGDFRSYGAFIRPAVKGADSVRYSIKWLQGLSEIIIDNERCPKACKEFLEYEYERTKDGEIISGYPDKNNHCIDAVRYALNNLWRRRGE